jgi:hypothetical protein
MAKATPEQIEEQRRYANDVNALVECRAICDRALTVFVDRYEYAPTRVWTSLQPSRFTEELWIGCIIRGREIVFPRTLIFPARDLGLGTQD